MSDDEKKIIAGDGTTVIGNVSGTFGRGCTIIGPTDNRGNTILNQPGAYGYNAHAGPGTIAVGAFAGAGSNMGVVFAEIAKIIQNTGDQALIKAIGDLCHELDKPQKDKSRISLLWNTVKTAPVLIKDWKELLSTVSAWITSNV